MGTNIAEPISNAEGRELLDQAARRWLDMSREEFITAWEAGAFADVDHLAAQQVAMLLPFARGAVTVDFHMAQNGQLTTYAEFAEPGIDLSVGATVTARDAEGNHRTATVASIVGDEIVLTLNTPNP